MSLQFWVKCGTKFPLIDDLEALLKEAVVRATFEAPLRHNSVETFDEYNTGKNVGKGTPTVFWDIVPNSDKCEIYAYMAGGGCTLPGKAMVSNARCRIRRCYQVSLLDVMTSYGLNACPPLLVGVGVATSVETAALLSKKALMRPIRQLTMIMKEQQAWKSLLEDGINADRPWTAGNGRKILCYGRTYRKYSTTSICNRCSRKRRMLESHDADTLYFDKDLNYTITTHSGVTL